MDPKQTSKAVCVLGMHRSGTSALTGTLNLLGIELGNKLGKANQFNPKGYWEHLGFVHLHQKVLNALFSSWDSTKPLPENWWKHPGMATYRNELLRIVKNDFGPKKLWGWKDPRTCLLLPLWKGILDQLHIEPCYIIAVRNPLEVAASLYRRNHFPQSKSLQLWNLYTLNSLKWTANSKRVVIHYHSFLSDWESQLRTISKVFDIPWPHNEKQLRKSISNFVKPNLRHSNSSFNDLKKLGNFSEEAILLYEKLLDAESKDPLLQSADFMKSIDSLYDNLAKTPSIPLPASVAANRPANQPANRPTNRPTNQTPNQPTNQPANQPTNQPANQPANQPPNQPANQPANQPDDLTDTMPVTMPAFPPAAPNIGSFSSLTRRYTKYVSNPSVNYKQFSKPNPLNFFPRKADT